MITKHAGTGGSVTVDTVTAQLLYEVQGTRYLGPDVTTDLTSIRLAAVGADRVGVTGVRGSAPPERLKVCVNELGGHRNSVELVLTGLDIEAKAAWVREQLTPALTASSVTWTLGPLPAPDADTEEGASTLLRCTVQDASPGRRGPRLLRGGRGARAGVVPRLHDDRSHRGAARRSASTGPSTSTARPSPTPCTTRTAGPRWCA